MKIFLDTNILVKTLENDIQLPTEHEYVTFEKCVYELKNGYKRKLYDTNFLILLISSIIDTEEQTLDLQTEDKELIYFFKSKLSHCDFSKSDLRKIKKVLNKYLLRFEFGIANEYQFIEIPNFNNIGLLKKFFKDMRGHLSKILSEIEDKLKSAKINQILYEQVFGRDLPLTNFREILQDSLINAKDLEIVFAALRTNCDIFLSSDNKLIKEALTLGLNHTVNFRYVEFQNELIEQINTVPSTRAPR